MLVRLIAIVKIRHANPREEGRVRVLGGQRRPSPKERSRNVTKFSRPPTNAPTF